MAVVVVYGEDWHIAWKRTQDQLASIGKKPRVLDRRVKAQRKTMRDSLDPPGERLLPQASLQFFLAWRKKTAYWQHPAPRFFDHPIYLRQMLLDCHLARKPHGEDERRCQKRQVADGGPRKRRIEYSMPQPASADKAIRIESLPHLPRRVHLDILANGRQRPPGVDEQQPEVILPHELRFFTDQWSDQIFSLSPEMLKPVEDVKFPRLGRY